jgi:hypothetical protein
MKRFWLVLLSLGLVLAFSASAFAVDVKFSGSYYVGGLYMDKISLADSINNAPDKGASSAFFYQRLRLKTEFVVSPGLSLITRADIMERVWGATRSATGTASDTASSGTRAENENIAFDQAYVQYATPIGVFLAGYLPFGDWGTIFGNTAATIPGVAYFLPMGHTIAGVYVFKLADGSNTAINHTASSDTDYDMYLGFVKYSQKNFAVGLLAGMGRSAAARTALNYTKQLYALNPYFDGNFGPLHIEGEFSYIWGKAKQFDNGTADVDCNSILAYVNAVVTFNPVYFGGTFAYASGNDPNSTTKVGADSLTTTGTEWSPTLIMWNRDRAYTFGSLNGRGTSSFGDYMVNSYFYQLKGGVKPTDKLDVSVAISKADADQNPVAGPWVSKDMGWEVDVVGYYKITNNLSYMLGFGYLFTGDYFKGASSENKVTNDYLVINKLTLTF